MANPLFPSNNIFGNMNEVLQRFNMFKNQFQGNPEEQVRNLLQTGQMTQEQFQQLSEVAKQFQNLTR